MGTQPHPQELWSPGTISCSDPYKLTLVSLLRPLHLCAGTVGLDGDTSTKPCIGPRHHDGFAIWATMVVSQAPVPGGHSWWDQPWWGIQEGQKAPPLLGQEGFGSCIGCSGRVQILGGMARGPPPGFLHPPTRHFGCSNNPSFSPRRISPEVQQSSFYGYTGLLPKRYTQGVMTGESKYLHPCPCSTVGAHSWGDNPPLLSLRAPVSHTRGPTVPSTAWPGCQQITNTPGCFPANQGV